MDLYFLFMDALEIEGVSALTYTQLPGAPIIVYKSMVLGGDLIKSHSFVA